jgi:hypothetical protein
VHANPIVCEYCAAAVLSAGTAKSRDLRIHIIVQRPAMAAPTAAETELFELMVQREMERIRQQMRGGPAPPAPAPAASPSPPSQRPRILARDGFDAAAALDAPSSSWDAAPGALLAGPRTRGAPATAARRAHRRPRAPN